MMYAQNWHNDEVNAQGDGLPYFVVIVFCVRKEHCMDCFVFQPLFRNWRDYMNFCSLSALI